MKWRHGNYVKLSGNSNDQINSNDLNSDHQSNDSSNRINQPNGIKANGNVSGNNLNELSNSSCRTSTRSSGKRKKKYK